MGSKVRTGSEPRSTLNGLLNKFDPERWDHVLGGKGPCFFDFIGWFLRDRGLRVLDMESLRRWALILRIVGKFGSKVGMMGMFL